MKSEKKINRKINMISIRQKNKFNLIIRNFFKIQTYVLAIIPFLFISSASIYAQEYLSEELDDGVIRYYHANSTDRKPMLYRLFERIYDVALSFNSNSAPFGKSVAFLTGVSKYDNIEPDLPWVREDLKDMREFLLTLGGFDEVFVAEENVVTRDLLNDYMRNKFPRMLNKKDRLLFYFAGHGDDNRGKVGYIQFTKAKDKHFAGDQILSLDNVKTWCDETNVKDLLILLDSCASGLASTQRGDEYIDVAWKLSADPSRIIVTAGTGSQNTFEVDTPDGSGNGVFTLAFLQTLYDRRSRIGKDGFMTIGDIVEEMKIKITKFALIKKIKLTPRILHYDDMTYPGTFVFINPNAREDGIRPSQDDINVINGKPRGLSKSINASNPLLSLRTSPTSINKQSAISILNKYDFFARSESLFMLSGNISNPSGKGVKNDYKLIKYDFGETVILDSLTALMWKTGDVKTVTTWDEVHSYIRELNEKRRFAGYDDWRIPTIEEAMTLMEPRLNDNLQYVEPILSGTVLPKPDNFLYYFVLSDSWPYYSGSARYAVCFSEGVIGQTDLDAYFGGSDKNIKIGIIAVRRVR